MSFIKYIRQDWEANRNNTKGKVITLFYRTASYISHNRVTKIIFIPYFIFYRLVIEWFLGVELPWTTKIGKGLRIFHGQAMVINKLVRMGDNCTIRHSTTIGNAVEGGQCPVIGNNVNIGANVCIIGDITIGDNVSIGAGAVVVKSQPSNSIVAGNPAKVIRLLQIN